MWNEISYDSRTGYYSLFKTMGNFNACIVSPSFKDVGKIASKLNLCKCNFDHFIMIEYVRGTGGYIATTSIDPLEREYFDDIDKFFLDK